MDMELIQRPLGIYEGAIKSQEWEKMLADASSAGHQNYEISLDESDTCLVCLHWDDKQYEEVRRVARNQDIKILSAYFSGCRRFPLGSSSRELEERGIRMTRKGIDLRQNLGAHMLQVAGYDTFYEPHSHETIARYRENILRCLEWAEQAGVMLAIESVEVNPAKVNDTLRPVKEADSPWLQIYSDITNMKSLGIDPVTELPQGRGHIANAHVRDLLSDYFYGVPLGIGNIDLIEVFKVLDATEYRDPLTIEMWNKTKENYSDIIRYAWTFMMDKIRCTRCS